MRCTAIATSIGGLLLGLMLAVSDAVGQTPGNPCGIAPNDWCTSTAIDSCGRHKNERECRTDPRCKGMPYRGESVIACIPDGNGFWSNCPAVGCIPR